MKTHSTSCIDYFTRLLSRRDYSVYELQRKGKEKGFPLDEVEEAIDRLQNLGYQSDRRLVERLITASAGKHGKPVVKRQCWEKGINSDLFETIWAEQETVEEADDLTELKAKIERKYEIDDWTNLDLSTQRKVFNYLRYRGFNPVEICDRWQREDD
jgi:regulatory protein